MTEDITLSEWQEELRKLGVVPEKALADIEESVYKALCTLWKKHQRPPTYREINDLVDPELPKYRIRDSLHKLLREKRVWHVRRGVWVPRDVEENTNG